MASQSLSLLTDSVAQSSPNKISVRCGSIEGSLHLDKLSIGPSGKEGSIKCIYCSAKSNRGKNAHNLMAREIGSGSKLFITKL